MTSATAIDRVEKAFHDFKDANDKALRQKVDQGYVDAQLQERLTALNADIDRAMDAAKQRVDALERRIETDGIYRGTRGGVTPEQEQAHLASFNRLVVPAGRAGRAAVSLDEYRAYGAALEKYLRVGADNLSPTERAALTVGSDPEGGYWVMPDKSGRIVQKTFETSPMRQICAVQSISGDAHEGITDLNEAGAGWVGEVGSRAETTTPGVGTWRIPVMEQYANPKATQKLLDDAAVDVEAWLGAKVADKFARLENTAFVAGDGNNKPKGFLSYATATTDDASRAWGTFQVVHTGVNGGFHATLPGDTFITLLFKLKSTYRLNARWLMSRTTLGEVRKIKDGDGNYMWQPNFQERAGGNLLGLPIVEAEDMPAIATNSLSIAVGDWMQAYQIVDRVGIRVLRDPFTAKPYVLFYTTRRVGGGALDSEAYKAMKFAA